MRNMPQVCSRTALSWNDGAGKNGAIETPIAETRTIQHRFPQYLAHLHAIDGTRDFPLCAASSQQLCRSRQRTRILTSWRGGTHARWAGLKPPRAACPRPGCHGGAPSAQQLHMFLPGREAVALSSASGPSASFRPATRASQTPYRDGRMLAGHRAADSAPQKPIPTSACENPRLLGFVSSYTDASWSTQLFLAGGKSRSRGTMAGPPGDGSSPP